MQYILYNDHISEFYYIIIPMVEKDLSVSMVDRQNILNNTQAIHYINEYIGIKTPIINWEMRFTIKQVAEFYDVEEKTIKRYIDECWDELKQNGYEILTWKSLQDAKEAYGRDINVPSISDKTSVLALFTFRAFLNIGMLLKESQRASDLRVMILDIVIDLINKRWWGTTKYINQNDQTFILVYKDSLYYRKKFTDALKKFIDAWNEIYPHFTNKVYEAVFCERIKEYRLLLKLGRNENLRHSLYSEVLSVVSWYEVWFAHELQKKSEEKKSKLTMFEAIELFNEFVTSPVLEPTREMARSLMATRDNALRQVIHEKLTPYIQSLWSEEYERFCGEYQEIIGGKVKEFVGIIDEHKDVFMRLKQ